MQDVSRVQMSVVVKIIVVYLGARATLVKVTNNEVRRCMPELMVLDDIK